MESNEKVKEQFFKMNFFQKIWYSISKFEKYPEMAALGVKKSIIYLTELILITCIILTGTYVYYINNSTEFEEDLNLSQKMVKILTTYSNVENEQIEKIFTEEIENINPETLIITWEIVFFISLFLATLIDVFTLSVFGILTCFFAKIKMKYKALFNMSIYALTLSILLRTIYIAITTLTTFKIKYFDVMYIAISYISLAAAIFIIKSNVIKQHLELIKIIEESKEKIEEKIQVRKNPKDEEKEDEDENSNNNKEDDEREGQGSNA